MFCPQMEIYSIDEAFLDFSGFGLHDLDKINATVGQQKVRLAVQDPGRLWKMKQEKLSPRYTTNINEIITAKT